ncbi:MAG: hypothetical protein NVSMB65_08030 [Chloroflexota bacterium]
MVGALLVRRLLIPIRAYGRTYPRLAALTAVVVAACMIWAAGGPGHASWAVLAGGLARVAGHSAAALGP